MAQAADTDIALDGESELDRIASDLVLAIGAEPVPDRIRDLALQLQAAIIAKANRSTAELHLSTEDSPESTD